jgi:hypothetical protein
MSIIILGNPIDGLRIFGPFESPEAAANWAEDQGPDWWLTLLHSPNES